MQPVRKELTCPSCGKPATVTVMASGAEHRWWCPNCKKLQKSEPAVVDAAPAR